MRANRPGPHPPGLPPHDRLAVAGEPLGERNRGRVVRCRHRDERRRPSGRITRGIVADGRKQPADARHPERGRCVEHGRAEFFVRRVLIARGGEDLGQRLLESLPRHGRIPRLLKRPPHAEHAIERRRLGPAAEHRHRLEPAIERHVGPSDKPGQAGRVCRGAFPFAGRDRPPQERIAIGAGDRGSVEPGRKRGGGGRDRHVVDRAGHLHPDPGVGVVEQAGNRSVAMPPHRQAGHKPHGRSRLGGEAFQGVGVGDAGDRHHERVPCMRIESAGVASLSHDRRRERFEERTSRDIVNGSSPRGDPPDRDRRRGPHMGMLVGQQLCERRRRIGRSQLAKRPRRHHPNAPAGVGQRRDKRRHDSTAIAPAPGDLREPLDRMHPLKRRRGRIGEHRLEAIGRTASGQFPLGLEPQPTVGVGKQRDEPVGRDRRPVTGQKRADLVDERRAGRGRFRGRRRGHKPPEPPLPLPLPAVHPVAHPHGAVRADLHVGREHVLEGLLFVRRLEARPLGPHAKRPHGTVGRGAAEVGKKKAAVEVVRQSRARIRRKPRRPRADVGQRRHDPGRLAVVRQLPDPLPHEGSAVGQILHAHPPAGVTAGHDLHQSRPVAPVAVVVDREEVAEVVEGEFLRIPQAGVHHLQP